MLFVRSSPGLFFGHSALGGGTNVIKHWCTVRAMCNRFTGESHGQVRCEFQKRVREVGGTGKGVTSEVLLNSGGRLGRAGGGSILTVAVPWHLNIW